MPVAHRRWINSRELSFQRVQLRTSASHRFARFQPSQDEKVVQIPPLPEQLVERKWNPEICSEWIAKRFWHDSDDDKWSAVNVNRLANYIGIGRISPFPQSRA